MPDGLAILCFLAFALAAITVFGHGMWVAIAWLVRTAQGESGSTSTPGSPCTSCGARFGVRQGKCIVCGAVPGVAPGGALRDELTTTARQLRRLLDRGSIPQEQYDSLAALIRADLQRLGDRGASPLRSETPLAGSKLLPEGSEPALHLDPQPPPGLVSATPPAESPFAAADVVEAIVIDESTAPPPVFAIPSPVADSPGPGLVPAKGDSVPAKPARGLADMLQSFMEESNIRWGEIIAALLIVGSSVGLVFSLRATLQAIPYAPAVLFALFTLAFHGAGIYTLRRWKLAAVSRVVLIISLLLVPLALSGAVIMSGSGQAQRPLTDPLFLVAIVLGLAAFGWVTFSASSELVGPARWRLAAGILACAFAQIAIQRTQLEGLNFWRLNAVLALPLAGFLIATIGQLFSARHKTRLSQARVTQTLLVLGTVTFAFLAPLALILVRSKFQWSAIAQLSPGLSLAAAAILALGLLIHRRALARSLAPYQTAGTAILIFASALLLMFVGFTWPDPELLVTVGLINCVILAILGFVAELPLLYAPAVACAALASVVGLHLGQGRFAGGQQLSQKLVQAAVMGRSAFLLTGLAVVVTGLSGLAFARRRTGDGRMLLASAGGLAALSLVIALVSGFLPLDDWATNLDGDLAALIFLFYALVLLAAAPRLPWPAIAGGGSLLLWIALVQALWQNDACRAWLASLGWLPDRPILLATLVHGLLTAMASAALLGRQLVQPGRTGEQRFDPLVALWDGQWRLAPGIPGLSQVLATSAALSLAAALPAILWVWNDRFGWHAVFALWAALGWAALTAGQRWKWAISGLQIMLALAPALALAGSWQAPPRGSDWVFEPGHILGQVELLAWGSVLWCVVRRLTFRWRGWRDLLHAPWFAVDQIALAACSVALPLVAMFLALPLVGWELGFSARPDEVLTTIFSSTEARGWISLAVVLAALFAALWERVNLAALVGLGIASFAGIWLAGEPFQTQAAAASAVRWAAAVYSVVWAAAFIARDPLRLAAKSLSWLRWSRTTQRIGGMEIALRPKDWFCAQPLLLGGLTILIITIVAVAQSTGGAALRGPLPGSIFDRVGATANYAGPLLALVAVLLGYALRQRQAGFAMGGSALFQLAINLAFLLYVSKTPPQPAGVRAIEWLQWNSLAAGGYALVWLGLNRWITPPATNPPLTMASRIMLDVQIAAAGIGAAAIAVWAAAAIFLQPAAPPIEIVVLGHWLSYAAVLLVLVALIWVAVLREANFILAFVRDLVAGTLVGLVALIAASAHAASFGGGWVAYHTLTAGWMIVGILVCASVVFRSAKERAFREAKGISLPHHLTAAAIAALIAMLALRGNDSDPEQPWWSLAATLCSFAIATALGLSVRSQLYAYAATLLAGLAVILYWLAPATQPWNFVLFGSSPAPLELVVLAIVAAASIWLWCEISSQATRNESFDHGFPGPRVHVLAIDGLLPLYFLLRLVHALFANFASPQALHSIPGYLIVASAATLAVGAMLVAMLGDRRAYITLAAAYWWGVCAWLLAISLAGPWLPLAEHRLVAMFTALALHLALTGQIWSYGANLAAWGTKVGISDPIGGLTRTARWLPVVSLLLAGLVCLADLIFVLNVHLDYLRTTAALGPGIAAWGVLCLAQEKRKDTLQLAALLLAGLTAIYLAWAQIDPQHTSASWLIRVFRLLMVLAALTFMYGLALPRWLLTTGSWNAATRRAGYIAGSAAVLTFIATLALEVALFQPGINTTAVDDLQVAAVAVVLLLLIAGLVSLALLPGRDPLLLSETNRQAYVYAAQVIAALLFAHLYVCRPLWFDGVLRPYWPFIVIGLAFVGVGSGELFQRFGIRVLAEPLLRTGALLPLLPVIGMWVVGRTDDAQILLVVGLLYLGVSYTRKSWVAMAAAALAGNGALWALLVDFQFNFAGHPQFWLIPPAASVLLAAQVNRHRLKPELLTTIRYGCTVVIYVSSTSEIFLRGIGDSLWPPMALLVLAVLGALAGIALRVRAFLFLGTAFTVLALVAMVAHAAQAIDHLWPWWVFGITVGIAILVLFGIFEKKRPEVLALIARLRQWEQ